MNKYEEKAAEYINSTRKPGKFEGKHPVIVYAYDRYLEGMNDPSIDFPDGDSYSVIAFHDDDEPMLRAIIEAWNAADLNLSDEPLPVGVIFHEHDDGSIEGAVYETLREFEQAQFRLEVESDTQWVFEEKHKREEY